MQTVSERAFDELIEKTEGLLVVDFFADWCGPCKTLTPILENVSTAYPDIPFVKVDTERSPNLSRAFGVRSLPTVLILSTVAGQRTADVVAVSVGVKPATFWKQTIDQALAPAPGVFSFLTRWFSRG